MSTPTYKPRIFTFERSGWHKPICSLTQSIALIGSLLGSWSLSPPLIAKHAHFTPGNPASMWVLAIASLVLGLIVSSFAVVGVREVMDWYDERVMKGALTDEDQRRLDLWWRGYIANVEEYRAVKAMTDDLYRQRGL